MPPRAAISNGIITVVIVFFMLILGMLLKARYRLGTDEKDKNAASAVIPKAIPVAIPVEMKVNEARAYKQGDWWVLPNPELVVSRANEADTLRVRSGPKEDVFALYYVDAAESSWTHAKRLREQSNYFLKAPPEKVLETGAQALAWVTDLLTKHRFIVYTKWGRVPESERFYAFIQVETSTGVMEDLGELLVRRGYGSPVGQQTLVLPEALPKAAKYAGGLAKSLTQAKVERVGAWAFALAPPAPPPVATPVAPGQ